MIPEELLDEPAMGSEISEPVNAGKPVATITPADVQRAKDIIAGKIVPPPLAVPKSIVDFYEMEFATMPSRPTEEAIQRIYERATLEATFKGDLVAYTQRKVGDVVVLAVGFENIKSLTSQLSREERSKIFITDTCS